MAQNTRKLVGVILMLAMLVAAIAALTVTVAAADGDVTIAVTANTGTLSGTTSISWTSGDYSVVNYKNTASTAIRTSDSDHFRCYVGNKLTISGGNMSQVVITCTGSSYMLNNASNTLSEGWTVSASGTTLTYTATSGSATELTITIGKQSRLSKVVITPAVATDCDHDSLECGDTCPECETYTKEHKYSNNCVAECENGCGTPNPDYADHVYDGDYDVACNVCTATREVNFPAADSELTITEANTIGAGMTHDTTTPNKYYVTGVVESIANTTYGNLYIQDEEGNKLYVYGTYDADGTNRYDAMAEKPVVGMTITVYGVIGNYSSAAQMKNGWITEMVSNCDHEWDNACDTDCNLDCGYTRVTEHDYVEEINTAPTCTTTGSATYECSICFASYDEILSVVPHNYVSGTCSVCGEEQPLEATITFDDASKRTTSTTTQQIWQENGITVTYNKGSYTNNLAEYENPVRFYKGTSITISYPNMTKIVVVANTESYATALGSSVSGSTVDGKQVTIVLDAVGDSFTFTPTAQVRVDSITVYGAKECEHEYKFYEVALDNVNNIPVAVYKCANCEATENRSIVTFIGGSIRYADVNGVECGTDKIALRFGYQIDVNVIDYFGGLEAFKAIADWSWTYSAVVGDDTKSASVDGYYITEDGVTNLVLTNIPLEYITTEFTVDFTLKLNDDKIQGTFENTAARTSLFVLERTYKNEDGLSDKGAIAYAEKVLEAYKTNCDATYVLPTKEEENA